MKKKTFTLVELVVVTVLLAVIFIFAVPMLFKDNEAESSDAESVDTTEINTDTQ